MKSLTTYIDESLNGAIRKWLKPVLQSHINMGKLGNKMNLINIDENKLNKPETPFLFKDYSKDNIFLKIINNKVTGFTIASQLLRQPNKYLIIDDNTSYTPDCMPYWYKVDENNIYCCGLVMYDINNKLADDYLNIINIESGMFVDKSKELNKALLNDFIKFINSGYFNSNYKGLIAKPLHPRVTNNLRQLGFDINKENKETLIYKI